MAQDLPSIRALQPRGINQVRIDGLACLGDNGSAKTQIADHKSQDHNAGALVKERSPRAIEYGYQADTQKDSRQQEWQPEQWVEPGH